MLSTAIRVAFFFIIRRDKSPQVDGAVADRHVEHRWPPQFAIQSGEHLVTDLRIASACGGCVLCRHACECLKQVCTADDPHDFSILHDRHPFDAVFFSSKTAISPSGVSGVAVITERVMTSVTLCECDFTYSAASTCLPVRYSSHQERLRSVPASARRMRSPSLTIPRSSPCSSITGTALIRLARRILATSSTRAFGRTLMTEQTITSAAFMMPAPYRQGIYGNWHFGAAFERLCRAMSISSTKAFSQ